MMRRYEDQVWEAGPTEAQKRRSTVARMREAGFTFAAIGERLDVSPARARQIFETGKRDARRIALIADYDATAFALEVRKLARRQYATPYVNKALSILSRRNIDLNRDWLLV